MSFITPLEIGLVQGLIMAGAVVCFALAFRLLGFPDLTVEASVPLGAAVYATLAQNGFPLPAAVFGACIAGGLAGAVTAFLHVWFGVNKFLAGIVVVAILYSVTLRIMDGPNVSLLQIESIMDTPRAWFGDTYARLGILAILAIFWGALALAIIALLKSRPGVHLRAAGANPEFAKSIGVRQGLYIGLGIAACNVLAAIAGVLQADLQGFADVSGGQGVLILSLAAMAIGEAVVPKRWIRYYTFVIVAALVGSVIYHVLIAFALRAGLAATDLRLATGVMVLLVVALRLSKEDRALETIGIAR